MHSKGRPRPPTSRPSSSDTTPYTDVPLEQQPRKVPPKLKLDNASQQDEDELGWTTARSPLQRSRDDRGRNQNNERQRVPNPRGWDRDDDCLSVSSSPSETSPEEVGRYRNPRSSHDFAGVEKKRTTPIRRAYRNEGRDLERAAARDQPLQREQRGSRSEKMRSELPPRGNSNSRYHEADEKPTPRYYEPSHMQRDRESYRWSYNEPLSHVPQDQPDSSWNPSTDGEREKLSSAAWQAKAVREVEAARWRRLREQQQQRISESPQRQTAKLRHSGSQLVAPQRWDVAKQQNPQNTRNDDNELREKTHLGISSFEAAENSLRHRYGTKTEEDGVSISVSRSPTHSPSISPVRLSIFRRRGDVSTFPEMREDQWPSPLIATPSLPSYEIPERVEQYSRPVSKAHNVSNTTPAASEPTLTPAAAAAYASRVQRAAIRQRKVLLTAPPIDEDFVPLRKLQAEPQKYRPAIPRDAGSSLQWRTVDGSVISPKISRETNDYPSQGLQTNSERKVVDNLLSYLPPVVDAIPNIDAITPACTPTGSVIDFPSAKSGKHKIEKQTPSLVSSSVDIMDDVRPILCSVVISKDDGKW